MGEYNPKSIEKKWQDYWEKNKTFHVEKPSAQKFYCLDMFPYPSAAGLHVGHPIGYIATDIYSRYKRMTGHSVLHPMGWDAFGLPAEQHAINTGEHPAIITKKNCENFKRQLKLIGFSYDWDREVATCDPEYYRWTQWLFLKLYNAWFDEKKNKARPIEELPIPERIKSGGPRAISDYQAQFRLVYRSDAMVNWCPALGTVLANEEVINGRSERGNHEVIRKPMKQWVMRITSYAERLLDDLEKLDWPENIKEQQRNWIGKKYGTEITFKTQDGCNAIIAFTTRPDTLFGVTFFVLSPEHPLVEKITTPEHLEKVRKYCDEAKKLSDLVRTIENRKKTGVFTGGFVVNPIDGTQVPVYIGDYVIMGYGTGAVMGVPAHDERDFEFARTFQIDIKPVIVPPEENADVQSAVCEGEVAWTGSGVMLACAARVARELQLEGLPNVEAGQKITAWLEKNGLGHQVINYKLRDWVFSRQRYWGEPIPIIYWEDGSVGAVDESELPLTLPPVQDYKPSDDGASPLARAEDWVKVTDPKTWRRGKRETDTMPGWAGSCWYYLRFTDPHNAKLPFDKSLEKGWMPVDLYIGGAEHAVLHLLYARFWHKVFYDLELVSTPEPFQRLFNQGMIQGHAFKDRRGALVPIDQVEELEDGTARHIQTRETVEKITAKMSKSLRNVINPDDIIEQYGADTLRLYEMFMGPLDMSKMWDSKAISGCYRFVSKAWNFATQGNDQGVRVFVDASKESPVALKSIHKLVKTVGHDIQDLHFNTCVSSMMEFLNAVSKEEVSKETLEKFVLVLAPFAPHVAEELWERLGHKKTIAYEAWPTYDDAFLKEDQVVVVIQVNGKKRGLIEVSSSITEEGLKEAIVARMATTDYRIALSDRFITVYQPGTSVPKLVNVLQQG